MRYLILMFILFPLLAYPQDNGREQRFKDGISAYANDNYSRAAGIFHELEAEGSVSWELYYNLGNSYYRQGELGEAILYWEKAKRLSPGQEDIEYNLSIARQQLIDKIVLPEMTPFFRRYENLQEQLSLSHVLRTIGALFLILVLISGSCRIHALLSGRSHKTLWVTSAGIIVVLILLLSYITVDTVRERKEKHAIIINKKANVLSAPDDNDALLFILHEGSKVRINKKIEDEWANISYFDDKSGWIKMKHLGMIEQ